MNPQRPAAWCSAILLGASFYLAGCPSPEPPPKPLTIGGNSPRFKLFYCSGIERTCFARAWFAEEYDCRDMEIVWWSACEQKGTVLVCPEVPYDSVLKSRIKTRCSERDITWADVADGGHRTIWPHPR